MTLSDLEQGSTGIIARVKGEGAFRKRIIEMGFVKGKTITVIKKAPLQDPIEYNIMGYDVSLRHEEAQLVEVVEPGAQDAHKLLGLEYEGTSDPKLFKQHGRGKSNVIDVALVGNPNSGKTTLFNEATGARARTGNYSGVTVDSKQGHIKLDGYKINLIDLPGTYSLSAYSPEELYVRKYIMGFKPHVVINVIDASNLERNLYLTTQLMEMDAQIIIALNMYDEFRGKGDHFDHQHLGKMMGIPIIPTVGSKGKGVEDLFRKVIEVFEEQDPDVRHVQINYNKQLEKAIGDIQSTIQKNKGFKDPINSRFYAVKMLEQDTGARHSLSRLSNYNEIVSETEKKIKEIESAHQDDTETLITDTRFGFIAGALKETYTPNKFKRKVKTESEIIDTFITHKIFGFPIFLFFIWVMFQATFKLGDYPQSWIEQSVDLLGTFLNSSMPDNIFKDVLVNGIINGVGGVIVFLPNILILFFFISFMEDTGYMARAAFIMDKLMHKIGLHGKSFIPLIMGFGCNVPAIMATRTLENRNERLLTMLITPFMSCSARLPVNILIIGSVFDSNEVSVLFLVYSIGILFAVLFAILFKKTIFRSEEAPFVMELPPYRMPTLRTTIKHMWFKSSMYLKKMGGVIMIASLIVWAMGYFPLNQDIKQEYQQQIEETTAFYLEKSSLQPDSSSVYRTLLNKEVHAIEHQKATALQQKSFIGQIGRFIEPAIQPLGFDWRMGVSLLAGVAAKEVVVSTMGVLFQSADGSQETTEGLESRIRAARYLEGENQGELIFTPVTSFAYLMFILLYFPCIAVVAAVRKESGKWKWAAFMVFYTTAIAWIVAFASYQIGNLLI
jgi:ferrous iron transport protein B